MDSLLTWKPHVSHMSQRLYIALNQLYKFRSNTPIDTRAQLVKSLIYPIIDYYLVVYSDLSRY
jgi:hypothetical protein